MTTSQTPRQHPALGEQFAYLETTGRVTGNLHEIEIWFAGEDGHLYLMSGGRERADWVKNLRRSPRVRVRVAERWYSGAARVIEGEAGERRARELVCAKYMRYDPETDADLPTGWCREALPVVIDLD
jgi:deazaflavin-dependent oxidoreductase (nitroreductase family)